MAFLERNKEIVRLIQSEDKNYQEVANVFNITRERVRVIYKTYGGDYQELLAQRKKISDHNAQLLKIEVEAMKKAKAESVKFHCINCGVGVKWKDSNSRYFCRACKKKNYSPKQFVCDNCGKTYFAKYISLKSNHHYCCQKCYLQREKLVVDK